MLSVGSVTALLGWSVFKVLTTPGESANVHGFEQETPDELAEFEAKKIKEANRRKQTDVPFPPKDTSRGGGENI